MVANVNVEDFTSVLLQVCFINCNQLFKNSKTQDVFLSVVVYGQGFTHCQCNFVCNIGCKLIEIVLVITRVSFLFYLYFHWTI